MNEVQRWYKEQMISGEQLITINQEITSLLDIAGACERIKNTPIPYSYSSFIKKFIIIYSITLPFGFAFSLGWLTIPIVMFIFYVLTSLELIAEEIEEPFGIDPNDLPIARLGVYIEGNVHEMLHTAEIKALID
jgi:putative membrane protein